jgi:hypothetical protein
MYERFATAGAFTDFEEAAFPRPGAPIRELLEAFAVSMLETLRQSFSQLVGQTTGGWTDTNTA